MKKNIILSVFLCFILLFNVIAQKSKTSAYYYPITKGKKYGFMDDKGKVIIPTIYDEVFKYNYEATFENDLFPVKNGTLWGYCNLKGEIVIPASYYNVYPFSGGLALVELAKDIAPDYNKNRAFIDYTGKQITKHDMYDHNDFLDKPLVKENLIAIKEFKSAKWGYLNTQGRTEIPFVYDYALPFSEGLGLVKKNGLYGFIDKTGKEVIKVQYASGSSFSEGIAVVTKLNDTTTFYFIDKTGKVTGSTKNNLTGSWVSKNRIAFSNGLCRFFKDKKTGLIDKTGKIVIDAVYTHIYPYVEEGYWSIRNDPPESDTRPRPGDGPKKPKQAPNQKNEPKSPPIKTGVGYIDNTGKVIIDIKYKEARNFYYGLAAVALEKEKWGVIDMKGVEIVPLVYKFDANIFKGGLIMVKGNKYFSGEFGYVDKTGKWIWPMPSEDFK